MLIILLFCHYLADFCFTWPTMIRAKSDGHTLWPILQHALIHTVLVAICLAIWGIRWKLLVMLSILELLTHFLIDWGKGLLSARFPLLSDNKRKTLLDAFRLRSVPAYFSDSIHLVWQLHFLIIY